jgi:hypothetical protein
MKRSFLIALGIMVLTGCQLVGTQTYSIIDKVNETTSPSGWRVDCVTDTIQNVRRCFAGTFAKKMDHNGYGYGRKSIPFQIVYYGKIGPFLKVGFHTFPGRYPTIRLDDGDPITILDDGGGGRGDKIQPKLIKPMWSSQVLRARYHSWPEGHQDIIIENLFGLEEAWNRLQEIIYRHDPAKTI